MRLKTYLRLRIDTIQAYLPHDVCGLFWTLKLLVAVYDKAPVHVIDLHVKNLAARIFDEPLCGTLGSAYLEALLFAMMFKDRDLVAHLEKKIKALGVPCVVVHQVPLRNPYVMLFEDQDD